MEIFLEEYERNKGEEDLILQNYSLAPGNYYFVDINTGEVLDSLLVKKDTEKDSLYRKFRDRDSLSVLLEMNKPIDATKQIHSNNYLSFFIKKDKLSGTASSMEKINNAIERYYDVFSDYSTKYDAKKMELLKGLNIEDRPEREEEIMKIKNWIMDNIQEFNKLQDFLADKNYLKIFFVSSNKTLLETTSDYFEDIEKYATESKKYIIPHIYNKNSYNRIKEGTIYGVSGNNFGLNDKKPFLLNRTKPNELPFMVSMEDIMKQKLFFDWLYALTSSGKNNIYIGKIVTGRDNNGKNLVTGYGANEYLNNPAFKGYYLRTLKEKNEAEIVDFDIINSLHFEDDGMFIKDYLDLPKSVRLDDYYKTSKHKLSEAMGIIDSALYAKTLRSGFFADAKNVSKDDIVLKNIILNTRDIFIRWYVKGYELTELSTLESETFELLLRHLRLNQYVSLANAYNVRKSLLKYIKENIGEGLDNMEEYRELQIRNQLLELVNRDEAYQLESEELFAFALGQSLYFLISKSEASDKNLSMIYPILQTNKLKRIKDLTINLLEKYSHKIELKNKRFNNLFSMVMTYEGKDTISAKDMIIAGFLSPNIAYEKTDKKTDGKKN
ncbi:hypothetical protein E9840_08395 [Tissierella creatinini]|nr:hypothetical protein E9840_08395 [Tissierella creatinini]TJX64597.1 hypothetical protein E8P77_11775 [Soehngenia saccharolytica]